MSTDFDISKFMYTMNKMGKKYTVTYYEFNAVTILYGHVSTRAYMYTRRAIFSLMNHFVIDFTCTVSYFL